MRKLGIKLAGAAGLVASVFAGQAYAAPTCTTTTPLTSGVAVNLSAVSGGNCGSLGDKIFGDAAETGLGGFTGITFTQTTATTFSVVFNNSTTNIGPGNLTANLSFAVAVTDPTKFLIDDLEKDFTFNQLPGGPNGQGTLTGTTVPATVTITCIRGTGVVTSGCAVVNTFAGVPSLTFNESLVLLPGTIEGGITDSLSQIPVTAPEPASLALLGTALVGLAFIRRRRSVA